MRPFLLLILLTVTLTTNAVEFPATLSWSDSVTLSTPLSGIVSDIKVEVGDVVEKGQLLATLDSRPYDAGLKRAKAELQRLKSRFEDAEREYQRAQELYDRTVLSQTDLQTAEVTFTTAQAEYHRAEAEVSLAKLDLEYSQIHAPFTGQIVGRHVHIGEIIVNKLKVTPMLRLARTGPVLARARVGISEVASLVLGAQVSVHTAGKSYAAVISRLDASNTNSATRSGIFLEAILDEKTFKKLPGLGAEIILLEQ